MGLDSKQRRFIYFCILLTIGLTAALYIIYKVYFYAPPEFNEEAMLHPPVMLPEGIGGEEPLIYDISKIKEAERGVLQEEPSSGAQVDIDRQRREAMSKASPEEKAQYLESLDKNIEESKKALALNPKDKKAKHQLFIFEALKEMAMKDFNYKAEEGLEGKEGKGEFKK